MKKEEMIKLVASAKDSILNAHISSEPAHLTMALMDLIRAVEIGFLDGTDVVPSKKVSEVSEEE